MAAKSDPCPETRPREPGCRTQGLTSEECRALADPDAHCWRVDSTESAGNVKQKVVPCPCRVPRLLTDAVPGDAAAVVGQLEYEAQAGYGIAELRHRPFVPNTRAGAGLAQLAFSACVALITQIGKATLCGGWGRQRAERAGQALSRRSMTRNDATPFRLKSGADTVLQRRSRVGVLARALH